MVTMREVSAAELDRVEGGFFKKLARKFVKVLPALTVAGLLVGCAATGNCTFVRG